MLAGVRIRQAIEEAQSRFAMHGRKTVLFVDRDHRFSKAQQDALSSRTRHGSVRSDDRESSFKVIAPLLSRSRVVVLRPLAEGEVSGSSGALTDRERGRGAPARSPRQRAFLIAGAQGDARGRSARSRWRRACSSQRARTIDVAATEEAAQQKTLLYDRAGEHYNVISAFIKSLRDSDPDAAMYWLMHARGRRGCAVHRPPHGDPRGEDIGTADWRW